MKAKGIAIIEEIKPTKPVKNPKSIINGIKGKISKFAGKETREIIPIL